MSKFKKWVIFSCSEVFKVMTAFILFGTVALMIYDHALEEATLPPYFQLTNYDWWGWVIAMTVFGTGNVCMAFNTECYRCRIIGDLLLQLSGFLLLLIGWAFLSKFPPINVPMVVYPVWGLSMIVAGRHIGRNSRSEYKEHQKKTRDN